VPEEEEITYQVSLFQLLSALHRVVVEAQARAVHVLPSVTYSVEEQRAWLADTLPPGQPVSFQDLMRPRTKSFIIATFLAILEVVREGSLRILLGKDGSDFFVVLRNRNTNTDPRQ
jgi:segregation and condensation protein A